MPTEQKTSGALLRRAAVPAGALLSLALLTGASEVDLKQCAGVDAPAARLACYDALAGRAADGGATAAGAAAPVAATVADPGAAKGFGRDEAAKTMSARIEGKFIEWSKGTLVRLDNGQVWKVMDEKLAYYPNLPENAEVEITRGMLGYTMEIKAIGRRISVKRIS